MCVLLYGHALQFSLLAGAVIVWVVGLDHRHPGQAIVLVALLNALPCFVIISSLAENRRSLDLLRCGNVAAATLISKDKRTVKSQRTSSTYWNYVFEFKDARGEIRRHQFSSSEYRLVELEDQVQEALLYNPRLAADCLLLDQFYGRLLVDSVGRIRARTCWAPLLATIPLLLCVVSMICAAKPYLSGT